ncbi:3-oxoacyl-ACP reductase FabG [Streptomyces sp. NBC_00249]|uniref:SDR family NAD(P)-dependent oxidoreductase n=1 Tax=Streptomyces sp. NBC_00249 TaxID=2975690 RepID=UPI0022592A34|nr:3-oxoacyl-ACP reductase family protein [Streptomyces sp. NBC_00249]MCX5195915.1 3-oxoacyl-ACP reductase FabG [Streptomyces sp. NBC_00249]
MGFHGEVAIVTGSSRGIGRAVAELFAAEGARVVVNYRSDEENAKEVVNTITSNGGEAMAVQADVAEPADVERLFKEALAAYGTVDVVVNNAGILEPKPFLELTKQDILSTLETNFVGVALCAQQAAKIMLERGSGRIVNIASVSGLDNFGTAGNMPYAASKAAVLNLTGVLAKALAPHVLVNTVAPGFVETGMGHSPEYEQLVTAVPLARLVQPREVAEACLFLASGGSSAMTGETLVVDAGFRLR